MKYSYKAIKFSIAEHSFYLEEGDYINFQNKKEIFGLDMHIKI